MIFFFSYKVNRETSLGVIARSKYIENIISVRFANNEFFLFFLFFLPFRVTRGKIRRSIYSLEDNFHAKIARRSVDKTGGIRNRIRETRTAAISWPIERCPRLSNSLHIT